MRPRKAWIDLADPKGFLPGNVMAMLFVRLSDPQMRADIIAYVSTLKGG